MCPWQAASKKSMGQSHFSHLWRCIYYVTEFTVAWRNSVPQELCPPQPRTLANLWTKSLQAAVNLVHQNFIPDKLNFTRKLLQNHYAITTISLTYYAIAVSWWRRFKLNNKIKHPSSFFDILLNKTTLIRVIATAVNNTSDRLDLFSRLTDRLILVLSVLPLRCAKYSPAYESGTPIRALPLIACIFHYSFG